MGEGKKGIERKRASSVANHKMEDCFMTLSELSDYKSTYSRLDGVCIWVVSGERELAAGTPPPPPGERELAQQGPHPHPSPTPGNTEMTDGIFKSEKNVAEATPKTYKVDVDHILPSVLHHQARVVEDDVDVPEHRHCLLEGTCKQRKFQLVPLLIHWIYKHRIHIPGDWILRLPSGIQIIRQCR